MNTELTTILGLAMLLAAGCEGRGEIATTLPPRTESHLATPPAPAAAISVAETFEPPPATHREQRVTRTIDKDADGDGIAERRIIVTDVYDDSGALVERIREQDFEADGIVDARSVTHIDGPRPPEP